VISIIILSDNNLETWREELFYK